MNKKGLALRTIGKFTILVLVIIVFYFVFIKSGLIELSGVFPTIETVCAETGLTFDEHMQIIYSAVQEKDYSKSSQAIEDTKKCFPKRKLVLDPEDEARILYEDAIIQSWVKKDYKETIKLLERARDLTRDKVLDAKLIFQIGQHYAYIGDDKKANKFYDMLTKNMVYRNSKEPDVRHYVSSAAVLQDNWDLAFESDMIAVNSKDSEIKASSAASLGNFYSDDRNPEKKPDFEKAFEYYLTGAELKNPLAFMGLGRLYSQDQINIAKALEVFNSIMEKTKNDKLKYNFSSYVYKKLLEDKNKLEFNSYFNDDYDTFLNYNQVYFDSFKNKPKDSLRNLAKFNTGIMLFKEGKHENAEQFFYSVIKDSIEGISTEDFVLDDAYFWYSKAMDMQKKCDPMVFKEEQNTQKSTSALHRTLVIKKLAIKESVCEEFLHTLFERFTNKGLNKAGKSDWIKEYGESDVADDALFFAGYIHLKAYSKAEYDYKILKDSIPTYADGKITYSVMMDNKEKMKFYDEHYFPFLKNKVDYYLSTLINYYPNSPYFENAKTIHSKFKTKKR